MQLTSNSHLKRNVCRWLQETNKASISLHINFLFILDKHYRTKRDTVFLRKDTGPTSDRILIFLLMNYEI